MSHTYGRDGKTLNMDAILAATQEERGSEGQCGSDPTWMLVPWSQHVGHVLFKLVSMSFLPALAIV